MTCKGTDPLLLRIVVSGLAIYLHQLLQQAQLETPSSILGFGCGYTDRHKVLLGLLPLLNCLPPILPWLVAVKAN